MDINHIQKIVPGPPIKIARAIPDIDPTPMRPARESIRVLNEDIFALLFSFFNSSLIIIIILKLIPFNFKVKYIPIYIIKIEINIHILLFIIFNIFIIISSIY